MSVTWFNGKLVEDYFALDVGDRAFLLGDGVFETIAVNHGKAIWLNEHLERMGKASSELGLLFDKAKIIHGIEAVLHKSVAKFEVLRITLSRGATTRGFTAKGTSPNLLISRNLYDAANHPPSMRLAVSKIRRNETAPSSCLKTLSYIDDIAAAREVMAKADDALMLNTVGHVASTTIGNIFMLRAGELVTPSLDQGILAGITRAKVLALDNWQSREAVVTLNDLLSADAVFVTNSLRLVTQVSSIDGKTIGSHSIQNLKTTLETLTERI
jgi:branched-chain amino acid aminotransferase